MRGCMHKNHAGMLKPCPVSFGREVQYIECRLMEMDDKENNANTYRQNDGNDEDDRSRKKKKKKKKKTVSPLRL